MTTQTAVGYEQLVNYAGFDPFKVACQESGRLTATNLESLGFREETWSRGESAYVIRMPGKSARYLVTVEEGLGTKTTPADRTAKAVRTAYHQEELAVKMQKLLSGRSFFREVAQCNVAMAINDLITVGAAPLTYMLHLAVESADWFQNQGRWKEVTDGTRIACNLAGCSWGGGETPVLRSIIVPGASLLSGSALGYISSKKRLINPANIRAGDAIILFDSSGVHANGISMLWDVIAPRLPNGYLTKIPEDGRTFGEAILAPTTIYARLIQALLDASIDIHYAINITGHGWCKLMRAPQPFEYVVARLPRQQPLFDLIQQYNPIDTKKMYRTFNMGAGFAIFVPQKNVAIVEKITEYLAARFNLPFCSTNAGCVNKSPTKRVVIEPKGIVFDSEDLAIR